MQKITFNGEILKTILQTADSATSDDRFSRPALCFIHIEVSESTIKATALDGWKMIQTVHQHDCADVTPFDCYIKPVKMPRYYGSATIEKLVARQQPAARLSIEVSDGELSYLFLEPQDVGIFSGIENIIPPAVPELSICVDAKQLATLLKPFTKTIDRNNSVQLRFAGDEKGIERQKPMRIVSVCRDLTASAILLPLRNVNQDDPRYPWKDEQTTEDGGDDN